MSYLLKFIQFQAIVCCFLMSIPSPLTAGEVDTVLIKSPSMGKMIKCVVVKPEGYDEKKIDQYPVVYLLHGYSGDYTDWIKKAPNIETLADRFKLLIICPDGGKNSWYFDSPDDPTMQYETHLIGEVIPFIDKHYRTRKGKAGRAITGLSMGGHGALFLALRHTDLFGAVGSMSGGVDLTPFPGNWEIADRLGGFSDHLEAWEQHSVVNMLHLAARDTTAFFIDCGTEDFFLEVNRALHKRMLYLNIPHHYTERPGGHNWQYWQEAINYQLLFFSKLFYQN